MVVDEPKIEYAALREGRRRWAGLAVAWPKKGGGVFEDGVPWRCPHVHTTAGRAVACVRRNIVLPAILKMIEDVVA